MGEFHVHSRFDIGVDHCSGVCKLAEADGLRAKLTAESETAAAEAKAPGGGRPKGEGK